MTAHITIWQVRKEDLEDCYFLEKVSFPPTEAVTKERIKKRIDVS
jgi:hypothetical protein